MNTVIAMFGWISLFAVAATSAPAQHTHTMSPYAHTQSSEVSTLSPEEVRELRNGEGMGLARPAELKPARTHRECRELTADQIESYDRLRGYPGRVKTTRGCRHGTDTRIVIPAKAGIQGWGGANGRVSPPHHPWIPAFAGMTCLVHRCLGSFDTACTGTETGCTVRNPLSPPPPPSDGSV